MPTNPLSYTAREIDSYLPTGWSWDREVVRAGSWDARRGVWTLTVKDGTDTEWPLVVRADEAARRGRLEALRRAAQSVYREALG